MNVGLICARVANLDDPAEGSVIRSCVDCGQDVWVDPDALAKVFAVHDVEATLICLICAEPEISKVGFKEILAETIRMGIGEK